MKVLIVDDDLSLLRVLEEYLAGEDMEVRTTNSGREAIAMLGREHFDVAVLDIQMPVMNGLELLKHINLEYKGVPVILLTAKGEVTDRIVGLELGADDYVVKPFDLRELLARIRSVMRRQKKSEEGKESGPSPGKAIEIDLRKREVTRRGIPVELTSAEFEVLSILVQNKGIVLSRERIMDLARGREFIAFDRSIDMHISHLRQKLEDNPRSPVFIKTVWGSGYIFTDSP